MKRTLLLAVAIALLASTASAQDWRAQLKMVDQDLRTAHYAHARKWSIKLINSMSEHLGTGPNASYTMGLTVAYRALAEAGLQKKEDADWYWHVATALYPDIAKRDWTAYGAPGHWAANHTDGDFEISDAAVALPVKKTEPKCPLSAIQGGYYQPVRVGAIIDGDGFAKWPTLVTSTNAPTLAYAAFEALKQWQFQAAAPVKYEVTVDFQPPAQ